MRVKKRRKKVGEASMIEIDVNVDKFFFLCSFMCDALHHCVFRNFSARWLEK